MSNDKEFQKWIEESLEKVRKKKARLEKTEIREAAVQYASGRKSDGYTIEDYYALPDERRVELIDGVFYDMGAPASLHQLFAGEFYRVIKHYIKKHKGKCIPLISPVDVQLNCDNRTMVQPDVMIVCDRSKVIRRCVYGAPDFVIEILSPSTKKKDMGKKLQKYMDAGVHEYWIVDPEQKRVLVYDFSTENYPAIYGFEDEIPIGLYGGDLRIDMKEVYGEAEFLYEDDLYEDDLCEENK